MQNNPSLELHHYFRFEKLFVYTVCEMNEENNKVLEIRH